MARTRDETDRVHAQWLVLLLAAGLLAALFPYVAGLFGAIVLWVWLAPVHRALARRMPPRWAALAVTLSAALALLAAGSWLLSALVHEASDLLRALSAQGLPAVLARPRIAGVDVAAHVASIASALLTWLSRQAVSAIGSATRAMLQLVVALFGLYYLLIDDGAAWRRIAWTLPFPPATVERLRTRFLDVTEAMLIGTGLTALVQATIVGGAFALVGLPGAVLWGVVTACVSILPILGSALVWVPGAITLLVQGRPGAAVVLAAIGAVLASNLDNVVRLVVYRRVSGVHPMITLVGAFAGVHVFGLIGALLGPLALLYFFELLGALGPTTPTVVTAERRAVL
jgi:predicted PurR-regulated permease PerM